MSFLVLIEQDSTGHEVEYLLEGASELGVLGGVDDGVEDGARVDDPDADVVHPVRGGVVEVERDQHQPREVRRQERHEHDHQCLQQLDVPGRERRLLLVLLQVFAALSHPPEYLGVGEHHYEHRGRHQEGHLPPLYWVVALKIWLGAVNRIKTS